MLHSSADLDLQMREWTMALETTQRQLAKRESDVRTLQAHCQELEAQLIAERRRAEKLAALSDRFGTR
jgi:SMC interacting uncharacterized protein involved in chromosome segregation